MDLVTYEFNDGVAVLTMDDGKANVLSPTMLADINGALDRAESDRAVVVLAGRSGIFSGGFDLSVMRSGREAANAMLGAGFSLAERLLAFRAPVVVACTGHAVAMGAFIATSGDYRIGVDGPFKIVANEVSIGMTMPYGIIELCRLRLSPSHLSRALSLAEPFVGAQAVDAGFLDEVVAQKSVLERALERAQELATLNRDAYVATKLRLRADGLRAVRQGFETDERDRAG